MQGDGPAIRRHLDARLVSYALSVVEGKMDQELAGTLQTCAAACLQAASGILALVMACRATARAPALVRLLDAKQRERLTTLLESVAEVVEDSWKGQLQEVMEVVVVMACSTTDDPEVEANLRSWAHGLRLDTRALAVHEDEDTIEDVVEPDTPMHRREHKRRSRSSRSAYQKERCDNLVARAVSMGVHTTRPLLANGQVVIIGQAPRGQARLAKLRGSMAEAEVLCKQINEQIRQLGVGEPKLSQAVG
jgi:hypothetical protein